MLFRSADVDPSAWFAPYAESAYAAKLIPTHEEDGKLYFYPTKPISRAGTLIAFIKGAGFQISRKSSVSFLDIPANLWFANYISFAKTNRIARGHLDGNFGPYETITRAEAARYLVRILNQQ